MWWCALSRTPPKRAGSSILLPRAAGLRSSYHKFYTAAVTAATVSSLSARTFYSHPGLCSVHPRGTAAPSGTLLLSRRAQSSLQKLLDDPNDPYLAALQDFNIPRIAAIVEAGPATTGVPAVFLQRLGLRTDNDVVAATRAQYAAPTPLTRRRAESSAEAVLQSLHAAGAERQREEEAATALESKSAQAAYDTLSDEEKANLQTERVVSHLFDGLCAMSAAMRVQAEDGSASPEELAAVLRVCEKVVQAHEAGTISAERWAADFASEMAALEIIWGHLGNPQPFPSKK